MEICGFCKHRAQMRVTRGRSGKLLSADTVTAVRCLRLFHPPQGTEPWKNRSPPDQRGCGLTTLLTKLPAMRDYTRRIFCYFTLKYARKALMLPLASG